MEQYNRATAVEYALRYATTPNPEYPYFMGDDCTNFISQCLRAGGCKNHYHPTHAWWFENGNWSVSWSVAGSLYWYIRVSTEEDEFGIRAITFFQNTNEPLRDDIRETIKLGDLIQYAQADGLIRHSTIITSFEMTSEGKEPLISQHSNNLMNIPWVKPFPRAIFHHIIGINWCRAQTTKIFFSCDSWHIIVCVLDFHRLHIE